MSLTASGEKLAAILDWWEQSERRQAARKRLKDIAGIDPDQVIMKQGCGSKCRLIKHRGFPRGQYCATGVGD